MDKRAHVVAEGRKLLPLLAELASRDPNANDPVIASKVREFNIKLDEIIGFINDNFDMNSSSHDEFNVWVESKENNYTTCSTILDENIDVNALTECMFALTFMRYFMIVRRAPMSAEMMPNFTIFASKSSEVVLGKENIQKAEEQRIRNIKTHILAEGRRVIRLLDKMRKLINEEKDYSPYKIHPVITPLRDEFRNKLDEIVGFINENIDPKLMSPETVNAWIDENQNTAMIATMFDAVSPIHTLPTCLFAVAFMRHFVAVQRAPIDTTVMPNLQKFMADYKYIVD